MERADEVPSRVYSECHKILEEYSRSLQKGGAKGSEGEGSGTGTCPEDVDMDSDPGPPREALQPAMEADEDAIVEVRPVEAPEAAIAEGRDLPDACQLSGENEDCRIVETQEVQDTQVDPPREARQLAVEG